MRPQDLASPPRRQASKLAAGLILTAAIGLSPPPLAAEPQMLWPIIASPAPIAVEQGESFTVAGQHFGEDPSALALVIRDRNDLGGAVATITALEDQLLTAVLEPVGRHFTGDLELHVVQRHPLADRFVTSGSRRYQLAEIYWLESLCYVYAGTFTVKPHMRTARVSEPMDPALLLPEGPAPDHGVNSSITLSSPPPPCPGTGDYDPPPGGAFSASFEIRRIEGPPPTAEQWRADLALAIDQTFAAYGLLAMAHPEGVVIGSSSGLTGGFALIFSTSEP